MKSKIVAAAALLLVSTMASAQSGDQPVKVKAKGDAVGKNCRDNKWFEVDASIAGDKVEGTLVGDAFRRGPTNFSGARTPQGFSAIVTYPNVNLKVEITGIKGADDTWEVTTVWNGGGPNNCESKASVKSS